MQQAQNGAMRGHMKIAMAGGAVALLLALALAGGLPNPSVRPFEQIGGCVADDGDTVHCGSERVRLMGIDAPEVAGRCRPKECPPGNARDSVAALSAGLRGALTIQRWGTDRYGRTLGVMRADGQNLACRQIRLKQAVYKPEWDQGDGVRSDCPDIAIR